LLFEKIRCSQELGISTKKDFEENKTFDLSKKLLATLDLGCMSTHEENQKARSAVSGNAAISIFANC
jgi:hypothetical protein